MAINRRDFLKTSALGLAGTVVLGSCVGAGKGEKKPQYKTNPFGDGDIRIMFPPPLARYEVIATL